MYDRGPENGYSEKPLARIDDRSMIPQPRYPPGGLSKCESKCGKNEDICPGYHSYHSRHPPLVSVRGCRKSYAIDGNHTNNCHLFRDNDQILAFRPVNSHYRISRQSLRKSKSVRSYCQRIIFHRVGIIAHMYTLIVAGHAGDIVCIFKWLMLTFSPSLE